MPTGGTVVLGEKTYKWRDINLQDRFHSNSQVTLKMAITKD